MVDMEFLHNYYLKGLLINPEKHHTNKNFLHITLVVYSFMLIFLCFNHSVYISILTSN